MLLRLVGWRGRAVEMLAVVGRQLHLFKASVAGSGTLLLKFLKESMRGSACYVFILNADASPGGGWGRLEVHQVSISCCYATLVGAFLGQASIFRHKRHSSRPKVARNLRKARSSNSIAISRSISATPRPGAARLRWRRCRRSSQPGGSVPDNLTPGGRTISVDCVQPIGRRARQMSHRCGTVGIRLQASFDLVGDAKRSQDLCHVNAGGGGSGT